MKVLHINTAPAGIGRYGGLLASGLESLQDVEVVNVVEATSADAGFAPSDAVRLSWARKDIAKSLRMIRHLVRDLRPDIVHDSSGSSTSKGPFFWRTMAKHSHLVITEHDPRPHVGMRGLAPSFIRHSVRANASRIIVHGPRCEALVADDGFPRSRISTVPHGSFAIFHDLYKGPRVDRIPQRILFFGEFRPNKGFRLLPEIAERVTKAVPGATFLVAGTPSMGRDLRRSGWGDELPLYLARLRRASNVKVDARFIPDDEVAGIFESSDICVMPYVGGTQSGVATIAMPLGAMVVATRVGDIPELVRDHETGLLAAPQVDSISEALVTACNDVGLRDRLRTNARNVAAELNWPKIAARTRQVYSETLLDRSTGRQG